MKRKYPGFGAVRRAACLLPAVLACAFAGAGQAQTLYTQGLDYAVRELTRELVDGAGLRDLRDRDKRVLVESEDFFELGTGLRLGLSDKLRGLSSSHLTAYGVDVALSGSDADAVRVLHGRWQRESETEALPRAVRRGAGEEWGPDRLEEREGAGAHRRGHPSAHRIHT